MAPPNTCSQVVGSANKQPIRPLLGRSDLARALRHVLHEAGDAPGLDRVSPADLRHDHAAQARLIENAFQRLADGSYTPWGAKQGWCEKPGRKPRLIAVPTVRDRMVLRAAADVVGVEAWPKLPSSVVGGRPGADIREAILALTHMLGSGPLHVLKFDVADAFASTRLTLAFEATAGLTTRADLLALLERWYRTQRRRFAGTHPEPGIVVGAPPSPLLLAAVLGVHVMPDLDALGARAFLVFDDGIVITKEKRIADDAETVMRARLKGLGLDAHPEKTGVYMLDPADANVGAFSFLGFAWRRGRPVPGKDTRASLIAALDHHATGNDTKAMANEIRGWFAYLAICVDAVDIFAGIDADIATRFGPLSASLPKLEGLATGTAVTRGPQGPRTGGGAPSSLPGQKKKSLRGKRRLAFSGGSDPFLLSSTSSSPKGLATAGGAAAPGSPGASGTGSPSPGAVPVAGFTTAKRRRRASRAPAVEAVSRCAQMLLAAVRVHPDLRAPEQARAVEAAMGHLDAVRNSLRPAPGTTTPLVGQGAEHTGYDFVTFAMERDARELVEASTTRASELTGSASPSRNLAMMAIDFLATNAFGVHNDPDARRRYLAKIEKVMGVRLVAFDQADEIAYGLDTLKRLAETDREPEGAGP
jgi:hypothetical protein